jgi:DNA modification methylase
VVPPALHLIPQAIRFSVAAINTNRRYIIGDNDADYVNTARQRISATS